MDAACKRNGAMGDDFQRVLLCLETPPITTHEPATKVQAISTLIQTSIIPYTILCHTMLHCTILLYSTLLYRTALPCTALPCTALCYHTTIITDYTIVYYTNLHYARTRDSHPLNSSCTTSRDTSGPALPTLLREAAPAPPGKAEFFGVFCRIQRLWGSLMCLGP